MGKGKLVGIYILYTFDWEAGKMAWDGTGTRYKRFPFPIKSETGNSRTPIFPTQILKLNSHSRGKFPKWIPGSWLFPTRLSQKNWENMGK